MKELIIGGARSGKSRFAEDCAHGSGLAVTYIATATMDDAEMVQRIQRHRIQRPAHWPLIEAPLALSDTLQRHAAADRCLLVDCLTLWLSNLLAHADPELFARERAALVDGLTRLPGRIILVSNEVGMGIVPLGALTRRFCDESGRLHQDLAATCDRVTFIVAGLPHILKETKK